MRKVQVKIFIEDAQSSHCELVNSLQDVINAFLKDKNAFDIIDVDVKFHQANRYARTAKIIGTVRYYLPLEED